MQLMQTVQEALLVLRAHMSQSEIARRTGVSQSKLSRWEAGEVAAGADDALRLVALAAALAEPKAEQGA